MIFIHVGAASLLGYLQFIGFKPAVDLANSFYPGLNIENWDNRGGVRSTAFYGFPGHLAINAAMAAVAKQLVTSKPAAVEKPEQVVPGSPTAEKLAAAPVADTSAMDAASDVPADPASIERGKALFLVCSACHGPEGQGGPIGPPLAGSEWVTGPVSNLIRIQLRGLTGPITVAGKEYNFPAPMAALAHQTDEQIADVLNYVRNSFGNKASAVTPEQVAALRSEVGKPMLTVDDLIKP